MAATGSHEWFEREAFCAVVASIFAAAALQDFRHFDRASGGDLSDAVDQIYATSACRTDARMRNHVSGVGRDEEVDEDLFSGSGVVTDEGWRGVGGNQLTPLMLFMLSV